MLARLNCESIYCPTNKIKISYLCQQNQFRRYQTRGRPTRAAKLNEANGRRVIPPDDSFSLLLPLSRVNHDAHFLPKKFIPSHIPPPRRLVPSFVPSSRPLFAIRANANMHAKHLTNPHAPHARVRTHSHARARHAHSRTHVERNTRSINTCNEIYFKPT